MYSLFRSIALTLITVLQYAMFFSAIASWIPQLQGSKLTQVLFSITEPIIAPFRRLLYRIPAMQSFPLDISFLLAYFTLSILRNLLY